MKALSESVESYIADNWDNTVILEAEMDGAVPLPEPYTAPTIGPTFRAFFYWDTYFTSVGQMRRGRFDLALANANNFIYLSETLGYIPNFNIRGHLNRAQLPVSSLLYRAVYECSKDRDWLRRAYGALEIEYAFWMSLRLGPDGLNAHNTHANPQELNAFYDVVKERIQNIPKDVIGRQRMMRNLIAEAENWDFTSRYEHRCPDFYAVDLNALLYAMERTAGDLCDELGTDRTQWDERAISRRQLCDRLLWNADAGLYYDYDFTKRRSGKVISAANCFALASGLPSAEQAQTLCKSMLKHLEFEHGISTCAKPTKPLPQPYQWDYPNAWPPIQMFVMAGCVRYGFIEEARRVAEKYISTVDRVFKRTGQLWEKYNAETGDNDVADEYPMPSMMGWTAGAYIYAQDLLEGKVVGCA